MKFLYTRVIWRFLLTVIFAVWLNCTGTLHGGCFGDVKFLDDNGIILDSKLLHIDGYPNAFNASFIREDNGDYLVTFRSDCKKNPNLMPTAITMGVAHMGADLSAVYNLSEYRCKHIGAHDGRLFWYNYCRYLMYTYLVYPESVQQIDRDKLRDTDCMRVAVARLDKNGVVQDLRELQYGLQKKEKNWTPFEYCNEIGRSYLYCVYRFNPKEIICIQDSGQIEIVVQEQEKSQPLMDIWERRWGEIRGGTPAIDIGEEYLTFFHSSFNMKRHVWYVCGALTFEKNPPFKIKRISAEPILAHSFYQSVSTDKRIYSSNKHILFPCGLICENNILRLICGENDIAIRIITFDKMRLIENLVWLP